MINTGINSESDKNEATVADSEYRREAFSAGEASKFGQLKARQFAACTYAYRQFYFLSQTRHT
jgi:hypothetical protein